MTSLFLCLWTGVCLSQPVSFVQRELSRLVGHQVEIHSDGYRIMDIANEGAPKVGCVRRNGDQLYLETSEGRWRLTGPLAVPRIAGPNYKVWVIGNTTPAQSLLATRLGILAPPEQSTCGVALRTSR